MRALKMFIIGKIMMAMDIQDLIGMTTAVVHRKNGHTKLKEQLNNIYEENFG